MHPDLRHKVRTRASHRCEYRGLYEVDSPLVSHRVEHVIPRKHAGTDDVDNLALACIACDLYKGPNLSGIDPVSGAVTPLFHPRRDRCSGRFQWDGLDIVGVTAVGRATVAVLRLNDPVHLRLRIAAKS
jgi:5-methylcytosine-specific restriction endonuclease McrA